MKKLLLTTVLLSLSLPLFASSECGPYKIKYIQAQKSLTLIAVIFGSGPDDYSWKNIGKPDDSYGNSYQAITQQAFAADNYITLRYEDGYNCTASDYTSVPDMIRISR
jgi:hypothetical protein